MVQAGYPIGLTIAPILAEPNWEETYARLLDDTAQALGGLGSLDLTVELITHRFTAASREVLMGWYPGSDLDMDPGGRIEKRTKFGSVKRVYDASTIGALRSFFERELTTRLPEARILYFT
jgi:spore photoproduct lyase